MPTTDTPVLIIGGGIVGLSASLFLSHHGIKSILVERHETTSIHPRARGVNRRTMELFREIGVDEAVRAAGEPLAASGGIYKGNSLVEVIESHKRKESTGAYRPPGAAYFEFLGPVEGTRGTQDLVEPVLLKAARDQGGDIRFRVECTAFEQDQQGVTATLRDRFSNTESTVRASYVIAADGAGGAIRGKLGVKSTGAGTLGHLLNILFEADLSELVRGREFSLCRVDRPEVTGLFTSINNKEIWVFHLSYDPEKGQKIDDFTPERCQELLKVAIGIPDLEVKVKSILPWEPTVRVAEKFQHGRVFLAGDAAHQMPPWGGQGATSGIADVHNLAWKLAAVIRGQAGESLLATYDTERLPVGRLVSEESGNAADERGLFSMKITLSAIWAMVRKMPRLAGYGYVYSSQAIYTEDTTPFLWWVVGLVPRLSRFLGLDGIAGSRVPHLWVSHDGRRISTLDFMGKKFIILAGADGKDWCEAAAKVASSLGTDVAAYCVGPTAQLSAGKGIWESLTGISSRGAVLVRPDGFVAWREWQCPPDAPQKLEKVLKQVLGL